MLQAFLGNDPREAFFVLLEVSGQVATPIRLSIRPDSLDEGLSAQASLAATTQGKPNPALRQQRTRAQAS